MFPLLFLSLSLSLFLSPSLSFSFSFSLCLVYFFLSFSDCFHLYFSLRLRVSLCRPLDQCLSVRFSFCRSISLLVFHFQFSVTYSLASLDAVAELFFSLSLSFSQK